MKGAKLWARYKDEHGAWKGAPTPYRPGDEANARRFLKGLEAATEAKTSFRKRTGGERKGPITVADYAARWTDDRKELGLATASDDLARLRLHILPLLGTMPMGEVRPRHIRDLVLAMRNADVLAPLSIRHVHATAACMFRTAVADELIPFTPCVLPRGILPKNIDRHASFRANAIFTREEVQILISDVRLLEDRRAVYALKALAGLRHSEASGLRWHQYDHGLEPLGALNLERTKTQVPRRVPVHPTLARILQDWREGGWERTYGRAPKDEDLIVPTRNMTERLSPESTSAFRLDLAMLGLRHRRGHDLRRTFITLAQVDGAWRDLLETITHGPRGNIINVYTTFPCPSSRRTSSFVNIGPGPPQEEPAWPLPDHGIAGEEPVRRSTRSFFGRKGLRTSIDDGAGSLRELVGGSGSRTPFTQIGIHSALRGLATDAAESSRARLFRLPPSHSDSRHRSPGRLTAG